MYNCILKPLFLLLSYNDLYSHKYTILYLSLLILLQWKLRTSDMKVKAGPSKAKPDLRDLIL